MGGGHTELEGGEADDVLDATLKSLGFPTPKPVKSSSGVKPTKKPIDRFLDSINRVEVDPDMNLGKYGRSLKGKDQTFSYRKLKDGTKVKNARGPFQIVKSTAENPGFNMKPLKWSDADDYDKSRAFAKEYVENLLKKFDGDWEMVATAYNQGMGRVVGMSKGWKNANYSQEIVDRYMKEGMPYTANVMLGFGQQPSFMPTIKPRR